jgi:hypothetical protein
MTLGPMFDFWKHWRLLLKLLLVLEKKNIVILVF